VRARQISVPGIDTEKMLYVASLTIDFFEFFFLRNFEFKMNQYPVLLFCEFTDFSFFSFDLKQGTTQQQDIRFSDKEKKLSKQMKFGDVLNKRVDMSKVKLDVLRPWISQKITD